MLKAELVKEINELDPELDTEELKNNEERREKLEELRGFSSSKDGSKNPTAQEIAEDKGFPEYEGTYVINILEDGKETPTHYHCQLGDGRTTHVSKEIFN